MKRLVIIALPALGLLLAAPSGIAGEELPRLRASVTVASEIVTLGDLFANAGEHAGVAVFRAPDLGRTGAVAADVVARSAEAAGLTEFNRAGVDAVTVVRATRPVTAAEITDLLRSALAGSLSTETAQLDIGFDKAPGPVYAAPDAPLPVRIARLGRSPSGARFDAVLVLDQGGSEQFLHLSGSATPVIEVVTAVRPLDRGEIVAEADLTVSRLPARQVAAGATVGLKDLVGLAARRAIRPGVPLSPADFAPPYLVARGDTVTIVYRGRGLLLTARGKALDNGTRGAGVSVVNLSSNRILTATVSDRGTVEVTSGAPNGRLALGAAR